jgi:hypothetical protein
VEVDAESGRLVNVAFAQGCSVALKVLNLAEHQDILDVSRS